jgi:hypothetical protein
VVPNKEIIMKNTTARLGALLLVVALSLGMVVGSASAEDGSRSGSTVTVKGVTYTTAQIEAWVAAVERHERNVMLWRLGALRGGIQLLPGDTLDRYLPEIRSHAVQVERRGVTDTVVARVTHIESKYASELRRVWANIARLAAWYKAEQARKAAAAAAAYPSGQCGGSLPPCYVMMRESRGNIHAQNPTSTASGKWQFLDSTWQRYGGYAKARYAPEKIQDEKARILWAGGRGCSHWSAC